MMRLLRWAAVAAAALCVAAALLSARGAPVGGDAGGAPLPLPPPPLRSVASREASTRCGGSSSCLGRWKALFLTGLFVEGVLGGLAPSCLRLLASPERPLHVANAFSGGVFFATGMLHILPEAVEHLSGGGHGHGEEEEAHAEEEGAAGAEVGGGEVEDHDHEEEGEEEGEHSFPTAYALAVGAFYGILFIEHLLLGKAAHSHGAAAVAARAQAAATGGPLPPPLVCAVHPSESSVSLAAGGADAGGGGDGGKVANGTAAAEAAAPDGGGLVKVPSAASMRSDRSASTASSHEVLLGRENVGFFSPNFTRALLAAFSVSIHSAFESLSLGLADTWSTALNTAIAIAAHKWATAASLGVKFEKERLRRRQVVALVVVWAAVTPVAAGIGLALDGEVSDSVTGTLFALSAGIFILIGAFEVPAEEFLSHPTDKWLKAAATTAGAVVIMGITGILVSTGLH